MILFTGHTSFTLPQPALYYPEFEKRLEKLLEKAIHDLSKKVNIAIDTNDVVIEFDGNQVNLYYDVHA